MFDKFTVAHSSQDTDTFLVFPLSYSSSLRNEAGEEIDGSFKDSEDWEGIQWAARVYEHLRAGHPRLIAFKGRDAYGYLLARTCLGPLSFLLFSHSSLRSDARSLALRYRWSFNALSALQFLHSRDVVHSEFSSEVLWVQPDLSLSLVGLWGAHIGHYCPTSGNHMVDINLDERLVSFRTDLFDWATWVFEMMTGTAPMAVLDGFDGSPNEMEAERRRRVNAKEFPVLEVEQMGGVVGKCWRAEYGSAEEAVTDVKAFLEGRGFMCGEDGDLVDFDAEPFQDLKVFDNPYNE